jgi:hypothetical protein
MGDEVEARSFTSADRRRFREKVRQDLDVFQQLLEGARFDADERSIGMEIELNLTDGDGEPAMVNAAVLDEIADDAFQTELGRFNIEINIPPRRLEGRALRALEQAVRASLNAADARARGVGAHLLAAGILPTLRPEQLHARVLSPNPRYALLNEQVLAARGEDIELLLEGAERLEATADSIAPEAACTSVQLHQMVHPDAFARYWNAAQAIAGVQVAVAANSPFFLGRDLWRETRIGLFEQSTDTRSAELKAQGVRPRVWFGERWITSIFDLFEENVRYFPALLPEVGDEDPAAVLAAGGAPRLQELRLQNGTVWRWNRPVYEVADGAPHVRVENRVLPSGPTVADMLANAAFYYGLVRALADEERPVWSRLPFEGARDNLLAGARDGMDARVAWPGRGALDAPQLVLEVLLPLAHAGLDAHGVDPADRDRLLGIVERRCALRVNGATWQRDAVRALEGAGHPRDEALRRMTVAYREHMHGNEPVHSWPPLRP